MKSLIDTSTTQLFVSRGKKPDPSRVRPLQHVLGHVKPWGGLWTSTWNPAWNSSAWVDLCDSDKYRKTDALRWWLLTPLREARILEIDTQADIERCLSEHGRMVDLLPELMIYLQKTRGRFVDYLSVAASYDAMHVTARGAALGVGSLMWDCESTLWFRWQFTDVQLFRIK